MTNPIQQLVETRWAIEFLRIGQWEHWYNRQTQPTKKQLALDAKTMGVPANKIRAVRIDTYRTVESDQ